MGCRTIKRSELIKYWMERGVRFSAPQTVHIDLDVEIGSGTYIGCSVHLQNSAKVGTNCVIEHFSIIDHSTIGDMVNVKPHTIITNAIIKDHAHVGPFAHIQENSTIGAHAHIGNFVETKNSTIGDHSKAKHLSYLGTAKIGNHVNIGAGTITCNFDGTKKHVTIIKDHVFIGTNNSLVAPITIHEHAFTAAGSVITKDVPARALAIARAPQTNKEEYAEKLLNKNNDDDQKSSYSFMGAKRTNNDSNIL
jgi:N-acetylglucosamine-1-phosphate uridyltransferase (contains nucleotidyltransferase and I-patch acetyltransferase domains)